ncbi:MAG: sulfite exporter TauE/SafE family protein [Rubrivivax sp.]
MTPDLLLWTLAAALLIGALVGAAGIGGVLLVPWLIHVAGLDVHAAVGLAMLAFIGPGVTALVVAWRPGQAAPRQGCALVAAAAPGALCGAMALAWVPGEVALLVLAVAVLYGVARLPWRARAAPGGASGASAVQPPSWKTGGFVGFASAFTATGGPLVLTPLLLARRMPLREVVALGQLIQLPIALCATLGHFWQGQVDIVTGAAIGAVLVPGWLIGQRLAPHLPVHWLARLVGALMLVAAALLLVKALA